MTDTVETRWENHNEAGRRWFAQGDYARAEQAFIAAIREATLLGADNVRLASSLSNLGQLKYRQKDLPQAEALFRRSLAIRERVLGGEHFSLVQAINNLAALHYARGELDQAEPLFRRALAISEIHLGTDHPDLAVPLNNLARLCFRRNAHAAAAPLLLRLLAIKQVTLGPEHPEVAGILTSLSKVRAAEGDHAAAEELARRAHVIRERAGGTIQPAAATAPAPPPPRAADAPPAPTTRSASLPWIEPPTSPALRRPAPAPAAVPAPPPAPAPVATGPVRDAPRVVLDAPAEERARGRRGVMRDWPVEPRRPWPRYLAAAVLLAGVGAGAWVLRGRTDGASSMVREATSVVAPVKTAEAHPAELRSGDEPVTPAASDLHDGATHAVAETGSAGDTEISASPATPPRRTTAHETLASRRGAATRPARDDAAPDAALPLPRVNVDRITNAIGASARARADSLGRTVTVKPPTFGGGTPR
ncbi:MAG TPA: tetratricopeptide repeat protein [Gemmatimonadaceae bacterium]|nr:tetratricopeptide repeat protein [Gemmatimonadaceae bacterium]